MKSDAQSPMALKPFFVIWSGQAVSLFGSQLVQFAIIWWLTKETGSATVLAIASLIGLLPQVFLGPVIGVLVDRWSRKGILLAADSAVALSSAALALLFLTGRVELWHIYVVLFVRAVGGGFHQPTMMATTTLMVPKELLTRIQGMNQTLQGALSIASAPLGAILLELLSMQGILALDVVSALFAIIPLLFTAIPRPARREHAPGTTAVTSFWHEMREGFQYVLQRRGILTIMIMSTLINLLLTPAFALLPLLVAGYFEGGALQLGWIQSAMGVGIVAGGLLLGAWGGFQKRIHTALMGLFGLGLTVMLLGLVPAHLFPLAIGAMFLTGITLPVTNGPIGAMLQATIAPELQGRVFTLVSTLSLAMSPLGLGIAGPVADLVGVRAWYIAGGLVCLVMAITAFFLPDVMQLEEESATGLPTTEKAMEPASAEGLTTTIP